MTRFTGREWQTFDKALAATFRTYKGLEQFLDYSLSKSLQNIAPDGAPLAQVAFDLRKTAESDGWWEDLILEAAAEKPHDPVFQEFARRIRPERPWTEPSSRSEQQPWSAPVAPPTEFVPLRDESPPLVEAAVITPDESDEEFPPELVAVALDYAKLFAPEGNRRTLVLERLLDSVRRYESDLGVDAVFKSLTSQDVGTRIVGITLAGLHPDAALAEPLLAIAQSPLSEFEQYYAIHALQRTAGLLTEENCVAGRAFLADTDLPARSSRLADAARADLDDRLKALRNADLVT